VGVVVDPRNAARALRLVAALAVAAALAVPSMTWTSADAQVPPLPPFPAEVNDLIQVTSPVLHPLCGNVLFANTIVIGTVPPELKEPLEVATANIYAGCALIPAPAHAASRCLDQDVTSTVLAQLSGSLIGGALPIAPPGGGQVVDAIDILLERYGGGDPGVVPALESALACQAATTTPPGNAPTEPGDPAPGDTTPGVTPIGEPSGPTPGASPGDATVVPIGEIVAPSSGFDVAAPPAQAANAAARLETRSIGPVIVVLPIVLLAVALLIGRGLVSQPAGGDRA
jgi:hypothetical protein